MAEKQKRKVLVKMSACSGSFAFFLSLLESIFPWRPAENAIRGVVQLYVLLFLLFQSHTFRCILLAI